jgi:hypothetical protein
MRERRHGPLVDWWDRGSAGILGGKKGKEKTGGEFGIVNRRKKGENITNEKMNKIPSSM